MNRSSRKSGDADANWNPASPNELTKLLELYDSISYLTRLLEQTAEKRFQLQRCLTMR